MILNYFHCSSKTEIPLAAHTFGLQYVSKKFFKYLPFSLGNKKKPIKLIFSIVSGHLLMPIFFVQQTALHWAAKHGKPEVIKLLASQRNVDINKRTVRLWHLYSVRI